ncbi:MAG: toll/interleukin-1 receptor domain-containing protein [Pirellulaceae bacterium]|nr:toll/interleukin-1 receptor domain-containing protein [Pirellulaceae bacterium]
MPFFPHHAFVTYARANNHDGWVAGFVERFTDCLNEQIVAQSANIYFDDESIERNEAYDAAIEQAVTQSEVLLVVASKKYLTRPWCDFERDTFLNHRVANKVVIIRYDDVSLDELHKVLPSHLGFDFFDGDGRRFDLDSQPFNRQLHKLCSDVAKKLTDSVYAKPLYVPSNPILQTRDFSKNKIHSLIGRLRKEPDEVVRSAVAIANAMLRGSVVSDSPNPATQHWIVSVVQELVRDMVSNDPENPTPAIVRFCVLLHELLPSGSAARRSVRDWFDEHCRGAGYDYDAVLGELPDFPNVSERYFWLDVFWDEPISGESCATAYAYIRCGQLEYLVSSAPNVSNKHAQLQTVVDVRLPSLSATLQHAINHVSVAVPFEELNRKWECGTGSNGTLHFLNVPVTVRMVDNTLNRVCRTEVEPEHVIAFSQTDAYSTHVQANGIFATGKLDGTNSCPCNIVHTLLRHATIGLWTRGPADSDAYEQELQSALLGKRIDEVPKAIDRKRTGILAANSCWQRAVLFFDPNIKPIPIAPEDNLFQNNLQLA